VAEPVSPAPPQRPTVDTTGKGKLSPKVIIAALAVVAALVVLVIIVVNNLSPKDQAKSPNYTPSAVEKTVPTEDKTERKVEESTKTNEAQPARYATIKGKSVIFRASHSTTSNKLGNLDDNEQVVILGEYTPSNTNEAISNKEIKLYNSSGTYIYTIPSGKAVKVTSNNGDKCTVSFNIPQYGDMSTTVNRSDIDFISGDKWYSIKRNTGETGWVFSKFVTLR
jgi:hypothetical protein